MTLYTYTYTSVYNSVSFIAKNGKKIFLSMWSKSQQESVRLVVDSMSNNKLNQLETCTHSSTNQFLRALKRN